MKSSVKRFRCFFLPLLLAGCNSVDNLALYLLEQGLHQGGLILGARDINKLLAEPNLDPKTEQYLRLSQKVIEYSKVNFDFTSTSQYQKYVSLNRDWVTQIVMAAPKDKLEPYLFSYPLMGKLPYKGFFSEAQAIKLQENLKAEGLDTYRRKVPAYSTLGWLADPVFSTMFSSPEGFVELLFHELCHSQFYFSSQADFNEAFASWFAYKASLQFFANQPEALAKFTGSQDKQVRLAKVVSDILVQGKKTYASDSSSLDSRRQEFFTLIRSRLSSETGLERLASLEWNNALVLSMSTYYEWVPRIEAYAEKNKLGAKELLKRVVAEGPSIVDKISANSQ